MNRVIRIRRASNIGLNLAYFIMSNILLISKFCLISSSPSLVSPTNTRSKWYRKIDWQNCFYTKPTNPGGAAFGLQPRP
ncbi:hypothetical protein BpHYR1_042385 [Brachionus plicatilis]|uniref:Uncharacterized protein n=1 Tax=Brachionus plicatilis TaxID=10195 RepID=A0A3M7RFE5_BRAPC|nr:hypothetical protein BpHYR1_042385 [Brachionus plicatilis]